MDAWYGEDNRLVAVFPTDEGKITTATSKLKTDLEDELMQYE